MKSNFFAIITWLLFAALSLSSFSEKEKKTKKERQTCK